MRAGWRKAKVSHAARRRARQPHQPAHPELVEGPKAHDSLPSTPSFRRKPGGGSTFEVQHLIPERQFAEPPKPAHPELVEGPKAHDSLPPPPSFWRKPESSWRRRASDVVLWIAAFAGMTEWARPLRHFDTRRPGREKSLSPILPDTSYPTRAPKFAGPTDRAQHRRRGRRPDNRPFTPSAPILALPKSNGIAYKRC